MRSAVSFLYTSQSEGGRVVLLQFQFLRPSSVSNFLACCVNCIQALSVVGLIPAQILLYPCCL